MNRFPQSGCVFDWTKSADRHVARRLGETCHGSINELEGELNLAGAAGGAADQTEAGAAHGVGRQSEIDDVEDVEELRSEFEDAQFIFAAPAERSVLDQCDIEIVKGRSAEGVAA